MKMSQVAVQLYTVRDFLKTPADAKRTLRRIRQIGYESVQVSGVGDVEDADLVCMLKDEGLTVCVMHEKGDLILKHPERVGERLELFGCSDVAYPFPADVPLATAAQVRTFVRALDRAGERLHRAGKLLSYHNHDLEFVRIGPDTILEILYRDTDARHLQAELDTYWVQAGGGSPEAWIRRLRKRLPILHMKDYGVTAERRAVFREIGAGNLDWKAIVRESDRAGCRWFVVEQDANWMRNDPFRSLRASFEYIQESLVTA